MESGSQGCKNYPALTFLSHLQCGEEERKRERQRKREVLMEEGKKKE